MALQNPTSPSKPKSPVEASMTSRVDAQAQAFQKYVRGGWTNHHKNDLGFRVVDLDRQKIPPPRPISEKEPDNATKATHNNTLSTSTIDTALHPSSNPADFSDVKLVVGEKPSKIFRLHRAILMEHSGFFQDVFQNHNLEKLYLTGTNAEVFEVLVKWIYNAATSFTIPSLQNAIARSLAGNIKNFLPWKPRMSDKEISAKKDALLCIRAIYLNSTTRQMIAWRVREMCFALISKITVGQLFEVLEGADKKVEKAWLEDVKGWLDSCGIVRCESIDNSLDAANKALIRDIQAGSK